MNSNQDIFTVQPYPRNRLLMVDGGQMGLKKHTVHGLVEFDITKARETLRQHNLQTDENLSFSAFFLACLGKAIDQDKQMQAYRNWRNQIIIFNDVDVNMLFEVEVDGKKTIRPHILRKVNIKSVQEIQDEIRAFQNEHEHQSGIEVHRMVCAAAWILQALLPLGPVSRIHSTSKICPAQYWSPPLGCLGRGLGGEFPCRTIPSSSPWAESAKNRALWIIVWKCANT